MIYGEVKVQLSEMPGRPSHGLFIWRRLPNGNVEILNGDTWVKEEGSYSKPTLMLDFGMEQLIVDELTKRGFKPSQASFDAGKLEATIEHLDDMRKIVFKEYGNEQTD